MSASGLGGIRAVSVPPISLNRLLISDGADADGRSHILAQPHTVGCSHDEAADEAVDR
jgi:hypothetical protein